MTIRLGRLYILVLRGQRFFSLGPDGWERYLRIEFVLGARK